MSESNPKVPFTAKLDNPDMSQASTIVGTLVASVAVLVVALTTIAVSAA